MNYQSPDYALIMLTLTGQCWVTSLPPWGIENKVVSVNVWVLNKQNSLRALKIGNILLTYYSVRVFRWSKNNASVGHDCVVMQVKDP